MSSSRDGASTVDEAVVSISSNIMAVQGDAASLDHISDLCSTVRRERGKIDILFASAGQGELGKLGEVTEEQLDKISP